MRLERKHIGAVEQRLIGVRVISEDPVHKFILSQHPLMMGVGDAILQQVKAGIRDRNVTNSGQHAYS
jgi:hypothetical protein